MTQFLFHELIGKLMKGQVKYSLFQERMNKTVVPHLFLAMPHLRISKMLMPPPPPLNYK